MVIFYIDVELYNEKKSIELTGAIKLFTSTDVL